MNKHSVNLTLDDVVIGTLAWCMICGILAVFIYCGQPVHEYQTVQDVMLSK